MMKTLVIIISLLPWLSLVEGKNIVPRQYQGGIEAVRLVGGLSNRAGRVEVLSQGVWGTVCDDHFSMNAVRVVCRSLGFPNSESGLISQRFFRAADPASRILLDDVTCLGTESSLNECRHRGIGVNNCGHHEDVSIRCAEEAIAAIRLVGGHTEHVGRLEVMTQGVWGTVCDDRFTRNAARVACRSLGFPINGTSRTSADVFYRAARNSSILLDDVVCVGNESSLNECEHRPVGEHGCDHEGDIGISCGLPVIEETRLVGGFTKREGRLEVRSHGVWGTVCDRRFDQNAAKVVCTNMRLP